MLKQVDAQSQSQQRSCSPSSQGELWETRSRCSRSSKQSTRSSASVAALKARAKAGAAQAQLAFAEEEAEAMKQQAQIQAQLHVLKVKKEAAAASAEADILEAAIQQEEAQPLCHPSSIDFVDSKQKVQNYIDSQVIQPVQHPVPCWNPFHQIDNSSIQPQPLPQQNSHTFNCISSPIPGATSPAPIHQYQPLSSSLPHPQQKTNVSDVAKYLMRRELVTGTMQRFDDDPQNYRSWKSSFVNITKDLALSDKEELDLLLKWLGPKSTEQAKRISAAQVNNTTSALKMVWQRLEETFGAPEVIEHALFKKIEDFPRIASRENTKLRELGDLLMELELTKAEGHSPGLAFLDTARGVNPILEKLPYSLQEKWISYASKYKLDHGVIFPPFSVCSRFVQEQARIRNDPSFSFLSATQFKFDKQVKSSTRPMISVKKTEIAVDTELKEVCEEPDKQCPLHNKPHPLRRCRTFLTKPLDERKAYLKEKGICFRCCASTKHQAKDCTIKVTCKECQSERHNTALHPGPPSTDIKPSSEARQHGGETESSLQPVSATTMCTEVCGEQRSPRSCAKICLAKVYPAGQREKAINLYAVMDEQSNQSLARSDFFDIFRVYGSREIYTLKTCSGVMEVSGRKAKDFIIESIDGRVKVPLPPMLECDMIPEDRSEIPAPEVTQHYPHLKALSHKISPVDPNAQILLLLGRDILRLHKVREQCNGPSNAPFAQRLDLGWVIVGDVCVNGVHKPVSITAYKTNTLFNGRPSYLDACTNVLQVKEKKVTNVKDDMHSFTDTYQIKRSDNLGDTIFVKGEDDEMLAPSQQDAEFLKIMQNEMYQDETNNWVAPLPFVTPRQRLPNNRQQALKRLYTLKRSLDKKPETREHFVQFMQKILNNQQAETAPPLQPEEECWYLPMFGVYHPQKPHQIRVVFDSSAKHEGVALNDVLLSGPDLNNALLGVLIRFRKEPIAVTADVEQMFYCFKVREDHRNFLRFLWHKDNDVAKEIIEYRMKVHVFGNRPSPSVAIYGLRKAAGVGETEYGKEASQFVIRNFYVDDGLVSLPTELEAITLLQNTPKMLAVSNLRLHKFASNSSKVMEAFPTSDLAKDIKSLNLDNDPLPVQRSLGISWSLESDTFTFHVSKEKKPFTKRGILSTVNSLYDPLGFVSPITVQGKALIREFTLEPCDWDDPLPANKERLWTAWKDSLLEVENIHIPRSYVPQSMSSTQHRELCVFSDASSTAIAAVAYIQVKNDHGQYFSGFVMGKSKLAPRPAHTIPRLELCAAVLAVEMAELICQEIDIKLHDVRFYTDSKIVLGYIYNISRRFYVYVSNRVSRIRKSSVPSQWHHVSSENNPADIATRPIAALLLPQTYWFTGPPFLNKDLSQFPPMEDNSNFKLIEPEQDVEVRPEVNVCATQVSFKHLSPHRFERFSSWKHLIRGMAKLIAVVRNKSKTADKKSTNLQTQAKLSVIASVQRNAFKEEMTKLKKGEHIAKTSPLWNLNSFIDSEGLLRVGGRTSLANLPYDEKHPLILPKRHHVSTLLVRYYHQDVAHQGRHLTEGALRSAGVWIIGARKLVSSVIYQCVTCRKLRGKPAEQKMANLPEDRLTIEPPFTRVGLDVFGPWTVVTRKTRGGSADSKRWAVLFSCLGTRAVHIEVIESMSTSSFINALRRFFAVRGPAKVLRSDRGTNFIGACKELKISTDDSEIQDYLSKEGCTWTFNTPYSSHMGGSWERMIGIARRILDAMLLQAGPTRLTHEVLTTLMSEVMAIMNCRPLVPITTDSETPTVLTPSMLLTQKKGAAPAPEGTFDIKDMYKKQWKHVQSLADAFWKRWRQEYLTALQVRKKWTQDKDNITEGDVVLVKDELLKRNEWPIGLITKCIPSEDKRIRKVEVRVVKQGTPRVYLRPINQLILLLPRHSETKKTD
ncbi:uncharacterized protein LOC130920590 [Corythoichthys intestinalis]|uniref:uncharacterized protein LOC130920590 n=1 Tax=Corythoichthys intestinalis TaxID=161448 RepID=UPI0025A638F9|nr:uncharacterized protein LOC130920590 [Corythoichthys intestinalis]